MKIKVCSYEQSKRLVELGFKLETTFGWFSFTKIDPGRVKAPIISTKIICMKDNWMTEEIWIYEGPALDVYETGILLPTSVIYKGTIFYFTETKTVDGFRICWQTTKEKPVSIIEFFDVNEIDVRTEALIWAIDNDFVKLEDLRL